MECLRKFVIGCNYNCNPVLTLQDIHVIDNYLLQFSKMFESLYGKDAVTPNIHLHAHLTECILDYGPVYSFWLFSFERYNGLLGKTPTNKRNIEIQFMNRFCRDSIVISKSLPQEASSMFSPIIQQLKSANASRGVLNEMVSCDYFPLLKMSSRYVNYSETDWRVYDNSPIKVLGVNQKYCLSDREMRCVRSFYFSVYPSLRESDVFIPSSCWTSKLVNVFDELYGSVGSRSHRSSHITSFWCGDNGIIQSYDNMYFTTRPGRIKFFSVTYCTQMVKQENIFWPLLSGINQYVTR